MLVVEEVSFQHRKDRLQRRIYQEARRTLLAGQSPGKRLSVSPGDGVYALAGGMEEELVNIRIFLACASP